MISANPAVTQSADDPGIKVRLMVGNDPGRQQDGVTNIHLGDVTALLCLCTRLILRYCSRARANSLNCPPEPQTLHSAGAAGDRIGTTCVDINTNCNTLFYGRAFYISNWQLCYCQEQYLLALHQTALRLPQLKILEMP